MRRRLEILRFGFELLQKSVALPHPVDDVGFACDKTSNVKRDAGTRRVRRQPLASSIFSKRARSAVTAAASLEDQLWMYSCSLVLQCLSGCATLQGGTPLSFT